MAAYAANKAFQIKLGDALWYELQGTGVDVLIMIGGLMNTQGDALSKYPRWLMAETAPAVREVLSAVGGKHMVIPGLPTRAFLFAQTRLMTRRRAVLSIGRFISSGLGKTN
jgi:short-subunit dehydrogenase